MAEDDQELTVADLQYRWRKRTVLESVDEAVADAGATEEFATPDSALRRLLELAWHDLHMARRQAVNGRWSVDCDGQVYRIIGLTRLVGPMPWQYINTALIVDGIYERIHAAIGTPTPLSADDWQQVRAVHTHG